MAVSWCATAGGSARCDATKKVEVTVVAYKLEYKLTQQTPMIHFQGDDPGATLRGTELKPKLDRFIREWCRRHHREVVPDWRQDAPADPRDGGHGALRYKVTLRTEGRAILGDPSDGPLNGIYFGNLGDQGSPKETVTYGRPVTLTIMCFVPQLRKIIDECIETFFVTEAFGTRQNRGFGCFTLEGTTEERATELLVDWFGKGHVYCIDYRKGKGEPDSDQMLGDANVIYRVLKGGLNGSGNNNPFVRSYLTKYFWKRGIAGEKRFLKKEHIAPAIGRSAETPHTRPGKAQYRYTRALLGTTDGARYKNSVNGGGGSTTVHYKSRGKEIQRYASPVLTRVCGGVLFLIAAEPDSGIFGKTFDFAGKRRGSLQTPTKGEFGSMAELFRDYAGWLDAAVSNKGDLDSDQLHLRDYGRKYGVAFLTQGLTLDACKQGGGTR